MHPNSLANLNPPVKPGEVLNPKGKNQYSYRDDSVSDFSEECKARGKDFITGIWDKALEGVPWAAKFVWEEIMPTVKTVDLNVKEERDPVQVPATEERLKAVAEILAETVH